MLDRTNDNAVQGHNEVRLAHEEIGRNYYNYTNRGWPVLTPWEQQPDYSKKLWIERALNRMRKEQTP
jgi:hypothetical protein